MQNIAVVGVGALGMRHLQSLLKLKEKYVLYGVEPNDEAVVRIEKEFGTDVKMCGNVEDLPSDLLVCIIATTASVRRNVFERLVNHSKVRYILFEKVLFQRKEDYEYVQTRLNELGITAWVNCARREWLSYIWLKNLLKDDVEFSISITGGHWGFCCNGIHFIDLVQYLSDEKSLNICHAIFEDKIEASKRDGYYELFGSIAGTCGKCKYFQITCLDKSEAPLTITIEGSQIRIIVDESKQKVYASSKSSDWNWIEHPFNISYQSELTSVVVNKILSGDCVLPLYEEAMSEHIKFLDSVQEAFINNGWEERDICPIT